MSYLGMLLLMRWDVSRTLPPSFPLSLALPLWQGLAVLVTLLMSPSSCGSSSGHSFVTSLVTIAGSMHL